MSKDRIVERVYFDPETGETETVYGPFASSACSGETARKLAEALQAFKSIFGDEWDGIVDEYKPLIEVMMRQKGTTNPFAATLETAKTMSGDGKNPMLLLAVATEMAASQNSQLSDPSSGSDQR